MSADKYASIFSRQMEAIVYLVCIVLDHGGVNFLTIVRAN